jgi:hypothetical protein
MISEAISAALAVFCGAGALQRGSCIAVVPTGSGTHDCLPNARQRFEFWLWRANQCQPEHRTENRAFLPRSFVFKIDWDICPEILTASQRHLQWGATEAERGISENPAYKRGHAHTAAVQPGLGAGSSRQGPDLLYCPVLNSVRPTSLNPAG